MSNYKKAIRSKVRWETSKGSISIEQLADLSLSGLGEIAKGLFKEIEEQEGNTRLDFLNENTTVDSILQLKFDIVKDLYNTKKAEIEAERKHIENKAHNERIMKMIYDKEQADLRDNHSIDELKALLK